jgi:hypothetical protein
MIRFVYVSQVFFFPSCLIMLLFLFDIPLLVIPS